MYVWSVDVHGPYGVFSPCASVAMVLIDNYAGSSSRTNFTKLMDIYFRATPLRRSAASQAKMKIEMAI